MSILIKGMEMPKNCDSCRIMVLEDTNCVPELFCGCPIVFKAHPQGVGHRPDYCPLIELPPHGDLIDVDALLNMIESAKQDDPEIADVYEDDRQIVLDWLTAAPTIIEREET